MTLENRINGKIKNISYVQIGDFQYNKENVDMLVRLGFREYDTVYCLQIETDHGYKDKWLKLEDLYKLGEKILGRKPKVSGEFVGLELALILPENENMFTSSSTQITLDKK